MGERVAGLAFVPVHLHELLLGKVEEFLNVKISKHYEGFHFAFVGVGKFARYAAAFEFQAFKVLGQTCYSLAHVTVTVLLENLSKAQIKALVSTLQTRKPAAKVSSIVDTIYPGGLPALEKDILEFVSR